MINKLLLKTIKTLQVVAFVLLPTIMFAPPIPPGPGASTPAAPIDNGIILLLTIGMTFGAYKLIKMKYGKNLA